MKLEINTKYDIGDVAILGKAYNREQIIKILDVRFYCNSIEYLVEKPNKERLWVSEVSLIKRNNTTLEERIKNGIMMYFGNRCY